MQHGRTRVLLHLLCTVVLMVLPLLASGLVLPEERRLSENDPWAAGIVNLTAELITRFSGTEFVPFTLEHQAAIITAAEAVVVPVQGPAEIISYREGYYDPRAPWYNSTPSAYVDVAFRFYHLFNATKAAEGDIGSSGSSGISSLTNATHGWRAAYNEQYINFVNYMQTIYLIGGWSLPTQDPYIFYYAGMETPVVSDARMRPVLVLEAALALRLASPDEVGASAAQASVVADAVQEALLKTLATLVEIRSRNSTSIKALLGNAVQGDNADWQQPLLMLEVTVLACDGNSSLPSPDCECDRLQQALGQARLESSEREQMAAAGVESARALLVRQRPPPPVPANSSGPWVPWYLDRLDQRNLEPLDGRFTANATGTGVNVYIVSSGIAARHQEFGYLDGSPGTRVVGAWGFEGSNPLEDCFDYDIIYGLGTAAASVIGGLTVGVARNVTLHSLRYRQSCLYAEQENFSPGALPAALDDLLSTVQQPALLVLDSIWTPEISTEDVDSYIRSSITERLNKIQKLGITTIAPAGNYLSKQDPCRNIVASHPGVISVASTSAYDQRSMFEVSNSSCVNIFAPGGGMGQGITVALPGGNNTYRDVYDVGFTSSWLAAGVAAQFLSLNPSASSDDVKRALLSWSTPDIVMRAGKASPKNLLYSNFTAAPQALVKAPVQAAASGGGLSSGAVAGIVVGAVSGVSLVGLFAALALRRKRPAEDAAAHVTLEWEIPERQLEICQHATGGPWILGQGSFGVVYRGILRGVQVVAVKCAKVNKHRAHFLQEAAANFYLNRDANIVQFYGICITAKQLMLVSELMEGGDLWERLRHDDAGELRWYARGKGIALDIVRGLVFLHGNNCYHRDIKSKNVLLTRDLRAKISDVGLAQIVKGTQYQQDGAQGSFVWAAPELLLAEPITEKSDIYSLGVVLWEMVTGEIPSRGRLRRPVIPFECPEGVAEIIDKCLLTNSNERPSAVEVYQALLKCPPEGDGSSLGPGSSTASTLSRPPSKGSARGEKAGTPHLGEHDMPPYLWAWLNQRQGSSHSGGASSTSGLTGSGFTGSSSSSGGGGPGLLRDVVPAGGGLLRSPFSVQPLPSAAVVAAAPTAAAAIPDSSPLPGAAGRSSSTPGTWSSRLSNLPSALNPTIRSIVVQVKRRVRQVSKRSDRGEDGSAGGT